MNTQTRVWNIGATLGVLLVAFVAVLTIKEIKSIAYVGKDLPVANTISVSGTGDAVAVPDVATFSFTVTETGKTVAEAQAKATEKNNAAQKALHDAGIAAADIQTTSYAINPHYDYSGGPCTAYGCPSSKQTMNGYDVSQTTLVKVRDLTKAGDIFTSIGSLGVQTVDGLSFSVDKPESVQAKARGIAINNAQAKADELAKQLGVSIVGVVNFTEDNGNNYPRPVMYAMDKAVGSSAAAPAAPEISPGQQKVTSNVTIIYQIR